METDGGGISHILGQGFDAVEYVVTWDWNTGRPARSTPSASMKASTPKGTSIRHWSIRSISASRFLQNVGLKEEALDKPILLTRLVPESAHR
jgi:hypothetical protein